MVLSLVFRKMIERCNKNSMKDKEENFGVPKVDYTPMGQVEMLGNFYRSTTKKKKNYG